MSDAEIVNKDNLLQSIYKQKKLKDSPEKKETDEDVDLVIEKERLNITCKKGNKIQKNLPF